MAARAGRCRAGCGSMPMPRPASSACRSRDVFVDGSARRERRARPGRGRRRRLGRGPARRGAARCGTEPVLPAAGRARPTSGSRPTGAFASPATQRPAPAPLSPSPPIFEARAPSARPLSRLGSPAHGHLSADRRPVGERAGDRRPGRAGRPADRHGRRRRRLPDHADPDLLRHPARGRGRLGDDPDHRHQHLRACSPTAAAAASTSRWAR